MEIAINSRASKFLDERMWLKTHSFGALAILNECILAEMALRFGKSFTIRDVHYPSLNRFSSLTTMPIQYFYYNQIYRLWSTFLQSVSKCSNLHTWRRKNTKLTTAWLPIKDHGYGEIIHWYCFQMVGNKINRMAVLPIKCYNSGCQT